MASTIDVPQQNIVDKFINSMRIYPPTFEFEELSDCDIAILMRKLRPSTSCGVDGLSSHILKDILNHYIIF